MNLRLLICIAVASGLFGDVDYAASDVSAASTSNLDFKRWGLVAIQDSGRRKPVDTFAKEVLIRITGRSTYTDKTGRKWRLNDFVLSALVETHDWKNEPMVLISSGQLIEQVGLDKTQRRFSFAQLPDRPIIWVSFTVSFFGMIFFARYRTPVYLLAALPVTLFSGCVNGLVRRELCPRQRSA